MIAKEVYKKAALCKTIADFLEDAEYILSLNNTDMFELLDNINKAHEIFYYNGFTTKIFQDTYMALRSELIDKHNKIAEEIGCKKIKQKPAIKKHKKVTKHVKRKKSRKAAIRSFCIECMGYVGSEVIKCTDKECPLYRWRRTG